LTLKKTLEEKESIIDQLKTANDEQQKEIERLKYFIQRIEGDRELLEKEFEKNEAKKNICKMALAKYLRMLQEIHNKDRRSKIARKSISIGQMIHKRIGENFKQIWEDGDEVLQLKSQLLEIVKEKESLEKIKRSK